MGMSSISPTKLGDGDKKKKRRGTGGDKETKEALAKIEVKIEDLLKANFKETNRLEVMLENEGLNSQMRLNNFQEDVKNQFNSMKINTGETKVNVTKLNNAVQKLFDQLKEVHRDFKEFRDNSPEAQLKNIQKKIIKECAMEITTPISRNLNVELKALKKVMDETIHLVKDH